MLSPVISVTDSAGVTPTASLLGQLDSQYNFIIPAETALGAATVTLIGSGLTRAARIEIDSAAPSLFTVAFGIAAAYAAQVAPSGVQTIVPVFSTQSGSLTLTALDVSQPEAVYLSLFGTGFDAATASSLTVTAQGVPLQVTYAGPQGSKPGLDQINVLLPPSLAGTGIAAIVATSNGLASNTVNILIK